jgi:hypothetical protein
MSYISYILSLDEETNFYKYMEYVHVGYLTERR